MSDLTPLAEALARYRRTVIDTDQVKVPDLLSAERIFADPGPLLEALAEAGVLEVEHDVQWCDAEDHHFTAYGDECDRDCTRLAGHEGDHECVNGRSWPREAGDSAEPEQRRYVTEWRPSDE